MWRFHLFDRGRYCAWGRIRLLLEYLVALSICIFCLFIFYSDLINIAHESNKYLIPLFWFHHYTTGALRQHDFCSHVLCLDNQNCQKLFKQYQHQLILIYIFNISFALVWQLRQILLCGRNINRLVINLVYNYYISI